MAEVHVDVTGETKHDHLDPMLNSFAAAMESNGHKVHVKRAPKAEPHNITEAAAGGIG